MQTDRQTDRAMIYKYVSILYFTSISTLYMHNHYSIYLKHPNKPTVTIVIPFIFKTV